MLSGIAVDKTIISVYGVAGFICGFAAWVSVGRVGSITPIGFETINLDSITATVIGGTSLFGGRGSIVGSVLAFPMNFNLIRDMGAAKAAYIGVTTPIVAMLLSTLFENYRWTLLAAAGAALAMIGLIIALSSRRGDQPAASTARSPSR